MCVGRSGGHEGQHQDLDTRPGPGTPATDVVGRSRGQAEGGDQQQPPGEEVSRRSPLHHGEWHTY